jgi:hypothetical protein
MLDQETTSSDFVGVAKLNGDFRKNYGLIIGAFLYLRPFNRLAEVRFGGTGFFSL